MIITRRKLIKTGVVGTVLLQFPVSLSADNLAGRWHTLANMPMPLQEIYPAVLNNNIHVAGGFKVEANGQRGIADNHVIYDPVTDQWRNAVALPEPRHHPNLVSINGQLFALGGFKSDGSNGWVMTNQTWLLDEQHQTWREQKPAPAVHAEVTGAALGNHVHLVGGRQPAAASNKTWGDHTDTNRHLVYDPTTNSWDSAAPALSARNSAACAVIDDKLFVVGGRTVNDGNVATLEVYDPAADRWHQLAPMPHAQGGLAAAAING